jgi:hypothetical protein
MPDDDQIELLRSVLAHAYEKRQPFLLRLVQAVKDYVGPAPSESQSSRVSTLSKRTKTWLRH